MSLGPEQPPAPLLPLSCPWLPGRPAQTSVREEAPGSLGGGHGRATAEGFWLLEQTLPSCPGRILSWGSSPGNAVRSQGRIPPFLWL